MRLALVDLLRCVSCRGRLELCEPVWGSDEHVLEGILRCVACQAPYPISRGVPRFPISTVDGDRRATAAVRRTYDFTWRQMGKREVAQRWEKDSQRYLELIPSRCWGGPGSLGMDVGCGAGSDLLRTAAGMAELVGVELSQGAEVAFELTRHLPNVHIVQADLHALPFAPKTFDFIYSFGVLHHLPQPAEGFRVLAELLKPDGALMTYLYEDFSERTRFERGLLSIVAWIRRISSRLPKRLLYALCWLATPIVWLGCSLPARLLGRIWPRLAQRLPFRHTLRWPVLASDLFDRFAPAIEWRFSEMDVRRLYAQAGFTDVGIRPYRGWVSWGHVAHRDAVRSAVAEAV